MRGGHGGDRGHDRIGPGGRQAVDAHRRPAAGPGQREPDGRRDRRGLRVLEPAVRHPDRQVLEGLLADPGPGVVVDVVARQADVDLQAPSRSQVVGRAAPHLGGRRLHDQPRAPRGVAELLADRREHHGDHSRPADRGPEVVGVGPEAAGDGRLHPAEARLVEVRQERDRQVRRRHQRRLGPVHARPRPEGPVLDAQREPELLGRQAAGRPRRLPQVQQRRRDGVRAAQGPARRRRERAGHRLPPAPEGEGDHDAPGPAGRVRRVRDERRRRPEEADARRCSTRACASRSPTPSTRRRS